MPGFTCFIPANLEHFYRRRVKIRASVSDNKCTQRLRECWRMPVIQNYWSQEAKNSSPFITKRGNVVIQREIHTT